MVFSMVINCKPDASLKKDTEIVGYHIIQYLLAYIIVLLKKFKNKIALEADKLMQLQFHIWMTNCSINGEMSFNKYEKYSCKSKDLPIIRNILYG